MQSQKWTGGIFMEIMAFWATVKQVQKESLDGVLFEFIVPQEIQEL